MKKIIISFLLVLLGFTCVSAGLANAQSTISNGANQPCYVFNNNLVRGLSGQDVYNLQALLIKENLLNTSQPTNYFGNLTFRAVIAFQKKYGISRVGTVGPITRAKLNSLYGCGVVVNPVVGPGQHCGGNIVNPPVCQAGYYCAPAPGQNIPVGDVGGICVINPATGQSPTISGVSGPTNLSVGQAGTWAVNASDPQNGTLYYSVVWGDEVAYPMATDGSASARNYTQTATFTHTYYSARVYAPTFYVRNNSGNTVSSSLSVNVGNSNLSQPTINYLQPNYGMVGASITISGSGFTLTGNKIKFGNLGIENNPSYSLNSSDGRTIVFSVPSSNYLACWAYGCMAPVMMTQPGTYNVSVINSNGTSNEISFTVTSSAVCTPNWQCAWGPCSNGYQGMTAVDSNHCGFSSSGQIACPALARACN